MSTKHAKIAGCAFTSVFAYLAVAQLSEPDERAPLEATVEGGSLVTAVDQADDAVESAAGLVAVGEYPEAINIVELEIETIERRSNRYNIELARPLVVLGDALAGVGDRDGALGAYDRAVHVTRVNLGLHHPSQVPIVYREAAIRATLGEFKRANHRHEYAYGILLRSHGGASPELLPGMFELADWYLSNYNIFSARALYEHALAVADHRLNRDDPQRIRALRSVAATYRSERFPPDQPAREDRQSTGTQIGFRYGTMPTINNFARGERALIEVINAVRASESKTDADVAIAILELGDWFLMFRKHERATTLYQRVWELLQSDPALLARTFESPTPLYLPLPRNPERDAKTLNARPRNGVVELLVQVDESGAVDKIAMVRSEPEDLMDKKVRRAVRRARFRPAFDGQTTLATDDVPVRHDFVYYTSDDDVSRDDGVRDLQEGTEVSRSAMPSASLSDDLTSAVPRTPSFR